jgi:2-C-methyl-D-erythritol 4-phosphate cytidylyltransferase
MVIKTIDRTGLWHSQTPQAFLRKVLLECHFRARGEGFFATDDAMLLERYGYRVGVVMGEPTNIKIIHPEDLTLAQSYLKDYHIVPVYRLLFGGLQDTPNLLPLLSKNPP